MHADLSQAVNGRFLKCPRFILTFYQKSQDKSCETPRQFRKKSFLEKMHVKKLACAITSCVAHVAREKMKTERRRIMRIHHVVSLLTRHVILSQVFGVL